MNRMNIRKKEEEKSQNKKLNDESSVECNKIESQAFTWTILFCICLNIFDEVFEKKIEREREKLKKKIRRHKLTMFRAGKHPKYRRAAPQSDIDIAASVIRLNDSSTGKCSFKYILKRLLNCFSFSIFFSMLNEVAVVAVLIDWMAKSQKCRMFSNSFRKGQAFPKCI